MQFRYPGIGHGKTPEVTARAAHKSAVQREFGIAVRGKSHTLQLLYGLADFFRCNRGRQTFAKTYGYRIRNAAWYFPQKAITFKAENAAPYAMQINRDNGCFDAFDNALHAPAKWQ